MTGAADRRLTDEERFPLLNDAGRRVLKRLREHPFAPRWNFPCGDRLTDAYCGQISSFEAALRGGPARAGWTGDGVRPAWLGEFEERCLRHVPFYRKRAAGSPRNHQQQPTCGRDDLGREPWSFVPDDQPLDDILAYYTSGTTGNAVSILSHPVTAGCYLAALRVILGRASIAFGTDPARVAIAQVCAQASTFTHATSMSYLGGAGYVKINLNPHEWRDRNDPVRFLDDCAPELLTGDPVAFAALSALPLKLRPSALVSSAMTLMPGLKRMLETRFGCPVFDVYSLNESRFLAVAGPAGHEILAHDVFVEIVNGQGDPCPAGERGEIVVTTGRNPFLPLLRYRTGDRAALVWVDGVPVLQCLEGRSPVAFLTRSGNVVNSLDITHALRDLPLAQFTLNQERGGRLVFRHRGDTVAETAIRAILEATFDPDSDIIIEIVKELSGGSGKAITYTSEIPAEELLGRPWKWHRADA